MHSHKIRLTRSGTITIATAHGLVRLTLGGGRNEFIVDLPDDLKLARGDARAIESSDHLLMVDGRIRPRFDALMPRLAPDGALTGLEIRHIPRVAAQVRAVSA